jgi:hypothetical protein
VGLDVVEFLGDDPTDRRVVARSRVGVGRLGFCHRRPDLRDQLYLDVVGPESGRPTPLRSANSTDREATGLVSR